MKFKYQPLTGVFFFFPPVLPCFSMQIYVPLLLVNAADDPLVHESLLSIPRALSGMLKQSLLAVHICVPAGSLSHRDP